MTRPQIIRADTHDLQNHQSPSAKDHSRQPVHPAPLGGGPPAPHQATALRQAEQDDSISHHTRSPRVSQDLSGKELQLLHEDGSSHDSSDGIGGSLDPHGLQRGGVGGGIAGQDGDATDADGDELMDDEMMDKISSSPSIDDGGYPLPSRWPDRADSLMSTPTPTRQSPSFSLQTDSFSSSPFLTTPHHLPLGYTQQEPDAEKNLLEDHHQMGEYTPDRKVETSIIDKTGGEASIEPRSSMSEDRLSHFREDFDYMFDSFDGGFDPTDLHHLLLPADDPLLDNSFDDARLSTTLTSQSPPPSNTSWDEDTQILHDDDAEDISFSNDPRFIDSGWGGECLRETEDIDFEFVYALHTFVATVEGQANATKGDTMVLLDDSNSYWWLVRVVKDTSIGYLPAEHIETPTERLARLNKHRNIDLSQTMLGDNHEKSKNPLKKAMRRRNAKTVVWAPAPIYHEASVVQYESGDEDGEPEYAGQDDEATEDEEDPQQKASDVNDVIQPLQIRGPAQDPRMSGQTMVEPEFGDDEADKASSADLVRASDDTFDQSDDGGSPGRSRKGTVRNTDSFFKDDGVETRKINLTPSLLRDDSNDLTAKPVDVKEPKTPASLEAIDKAASGSGPTKDDKKRKDKKPGMLSGIFKRKDKRSKGQEDQGEENDKLSEENVRQAPQPKPSSESLSQDAQTSKSNGPGQPQRQTSKLQKAPPIKLPPPIKTALTREEPIAPISATAPQISSLPEMNTSPFEMPKPTAPQPERVAPSLLTTNAPGSTPYSEPIRKSEEEPSSFLEPASPEQSQGQSTGLMESARRGVFPPIKDALKVNPTSVNANPEKLVQAKQRVVMDDSDSSPEADEPADLVLGLHGRRDISPEPETYREHPQNQLKERLSESPIQVASPSEAQTQHPPPLIVDNSSQEDRSVSLTSPSSSPELVEVPHAPHGRDEETPASTVRSSYTGPPWSDASLRAYLDDDTDVRDLLLMVHDKSDVKPAGPDHPYAKDLFKEENRKLGEISARLDRLLNDFLARRKTSVR